jgi:hypothetical protein
MKSRLQLIVVLLFIGTAGIIFMLSGRTTQSNDNSVDLEVVEGDEANYSTDITSQLMKSEIVHQNENSQQEEEIKNENNPENPEMIFVHVCGAVKKEGVYQVINSARVVDAIKAAGGLTKDAASYGINQAELLKDGMQIYIPTKKEVKVNKVIPSGLPSVTGASDISKNANTEIVNINTATKEELMKLNGVGEAKAALIINFRETNGGFNNINDLMKIKGIKQKFFDKIKDSICV